MQVVGRDGRRRIGRVVALDEAALVLEVLESTLGLGTIDTRVDPDAMSRSSLRSGQAFWAACSTASASRSTAVRALARASSSCPSTGLPINPAARLLPQDFIETGVTTIDLMNSLVRGQKLPIFSGSGLPHDRLAVEIAQRARLRGAERGDFALVFVGIGISHDTAELFRSSLERSGALGHTRCFSTSRTIRARSACSRRVTR